MRKRLYTILIGLLPVLLVQACQQTAEPAFVDKLVTVETFTKSNLGWALAIDAADNIYVSDLNNQVIRKITPTKEISLFAGTGEAGLLDAEVAKAKFFLPKAMTFDAAGNLYVAQQWALRKITPAGIVTTIAGRAPSQLNSTHPDSSLFYDSPALVVDNSGNLLVADNSFYSRILKLTTGRTMSVLLGHPFGPSQQGSQSPVIDRFNDLKGLAFDSKGNLFVADQLYGILKVTPQGTVTRFAGSGVHGHVDGPVATALFSELAGLAIDQADNVYVGDGPYIRSITQDGLVSTIAGDGKALSVSNQQLIYQDGPGPQAQFAKPQSLAFDSKGNLFVADGTGIRKLSFN